MSLFNKTFFKFTVSFIGILALSFAFTVVASFFDADSPQTASVEEAK